MSCRCFPFVGASNATPSKYSLAVSWLHSLGYSLILEFWRTWRFLTKLEIGVRGEEDPQEASQKVLLRSSIWNPIKTRHVL